jgi:hypothetical protein
LSTAPHPSSTPPIRPARALLDEVLASGGEIRRESKEGPRQISSLLTAYKHAENVCAETLRSQHAVWREVRQLTEFLEAMRATVDTMGSGGQRDTAAEWLAWCQRYVDNSFVRHGETASHADDSSTDVGGAHRLEGCVRARVGTAVWGRHKSS